MSLEKICGIIEEAGRAGVMQLSFSGGEALLRPDFREIVKCTVANRMRFALLTNGLLFDREMADFLASTGRCDKVKISIDGREKVHDAVRGSGSYAAAAAAIGNAAAAGLPCVAACSVSRCNLPELEEELEHLLDLPGTPFISCGAVTDCENPEDYALTDDMCREAVMRLARVEKVHSGRFVSRGMTGALRSWRKMFADEAAGKAPTGDSMLCPVAARTLGVRSDGRWQICTTAPEFSDATAGSSGLLEYWHNSPLLNEMRRTAGVAEDSSCCGCRYLKYCRWAGGGCYAMRKKYSSRDYYCLTRFLDRYGREGLGI